MSICILLRDCAYNALIAYEPVPGETVEQLADRVLSRGSHSDAEVIEIRRPRGDKA